MPTFMAGHSVIDRLVHVDKYVQEDIDMNELSNKLAVLDAIRDLLDAETAKLSQDFDDETQEHVIRLECRFSTEPSISFAKQAMAEVRQAKSLLKALLSTA
jgi:hypothetical protein